MEKVKLLKSSSDRVDAVFLVDAVLLVHHNRAACAAVLLVDYDRAVACAAVLLVDHDD